MESESKYQMFKLLGNEFTFDVDVNQLGCGLNGAVYFVSMDADVSPPPPVLFAPNPRRFRSADHPAC